MKCTLQFGTSPPRLPPNLGKPSPSDTSMCHRVIDPTGIETFPENPSHPSGNLHISCLCGQIMNFSHRATNVVLHRIQAFCNVSKIF